MRRFIFIIFFVGLPVICYAKQIKNTGTASYYTVASCKKEKTSGVMANGKKLNDSKFTAASWDYRFGTRLKVTNLDNGKAVIVTCSDRGPNKRLYSKGRIIDLSKASFKAISSLEKGIIKVKIEEI